MKRQWLFSCLVWENNFVLGGLYGSQGFVGCMRYIHIEGHYIRVTALAKHQYSSEGVVFDACQMTDRWVNLSFINCNLKMKK